jgi:hypothetical protein
MNGTNEPSVSELAEAWLRAKCREEAANAERIAIEERLIEFVDTKSEGSVTTKGEDFAITVTCRINRSLSDDGIAAIQAMIPEDMQPLKTKVELDSKGLDWLRVNQPHYYRVAADYVTSKPAKPGFKVSRVERVEAK